MAVDKLVDSTQLDADLTSVANAIRAKSGGSSQLAFPSGFVSEIGNIPSGGGEWDFLDMSQPAGDIISDITTLPTGAESYIFVGRSGIDTISLPNLTTIHGQTFYGALAKHIYIPKANNGSYQQAAFKECTNLVSLALPSIKAAPGSHYFKDCPNLEAVDLNDISSFLQTSHFENDVKLKILVLRRSSVITLGNTNSFTNTPFASGGTGGTLYVPASLISSYQSATNWSTILGYTNNQIKSIESTHTDPNAPIDLTLYYADGTTIPTS